MYDIGEHLGEKFLTMELLSGQSLSQRLIDTVDGKPRPLPLREIATLLDQLCAALTAAHRSGIIHCDLKPDNILLVNQDGNVDFVKIIDFGIAKDVKAVPSVQVSGPMRVSSASRALKSQPPPPAEPEPEPE